MKGQFLPTICDLEIKIVTVYLFTKPKSRDTKSYIFLAPLGLIIQLLSVTVTETNMKILLKREEIKLIVTTQESRTKY
jgi:hypothetical protein